jgi:hypothetical protein
MPKLSNIKAARQPTHTHIDIHRYTVTIIVIIIRRLSPELSTL